MRMQALSMHVDRHSQPCVQALSMHTSNEPFVQTSGHAPNWPALHEPPCAWCQHDLQITVNRHSQLCEPWPCRVNACALIVPAIPDHGRTWPLPNHNSPPMHLSPPRSVQTTVLTHRTCHHHHHHAHCRTQSRAVQKSSW
jgi:hypothetical protein